MTDSKGATFSNCSKYRYVLWRIWDISAPTALCIGLNPSNADASKDDPTIRQLSTRLQHMGYGGFKMTNLYAWISSNPEDLSSIPDPVKDNDLWINRASQGCDIIFCWGSFKQASYRAKLMIAKFPDAKCFGKTKNGSPIHPMALMYAGTKVEETKLYSFKL